MKQNYWDQSMSANSKSTPAALVAPFQARLLESLLALSQPVLLIGLSYPLNLNLLEAGMQPAICDESLTQLGRLARACLERGLKADLYWQSLESLNLPERYASIVLAPGAWPDLQGRSQSAQSRSRLLAHLQAEGELKILLSEGNSGESLAG